MYADWFVLEDVPLLHLICRLPDLREDWKLEWSWRIKATIKYRVTHKLNYFIRELGRTRKKQSTWSLAVFPPRDREWDDIKIDIVIWKIHDHWPFSHQSQLRGMTTRKFDKRIDWVLGLVVALMTTSMKSTQFLLGYVARTFLSWSRDVLHVCPTHGLRVFLRICHVQVCHVHVGISVSVQYSCLVFMCKRGPCHRTFPLGGK